MPRRNGSAKPSPATASARSACCSPDWTATRFEYLSLYHDVDIALDPFPYNGVTTTCDALWMGVPVVALAGRMSVSRQGVRFLRNVGLDELIAETPEDYVRIATELAGDLHRLADLAPRPARPDESLAADGRRAIDPRPGGGLSRPLRGRAGLDRPDQGTASLRVT